MQLTRHTDYALRLLIDLAMQDGAHLSIADVAQAQAISRSHLMKIANRLAHAGFIEATRGRSGGIRLARDAASINVGAVVSAMEPGCALISCEGCRLVGPCRLPTVLDEAMRAFAATLAKYSLADLIAARNPA